MQVNATSCCQCCQRELLMVLNQSRFFSILTENIRDNWEKDSDQLQNVFVGSIFSAGEDIRNNIWEFGISQYLPITSASCP